MSRISDVSSTLGQYMLQGWVLTDDPCLVCSIPLLRSPAGHTPERLFCAQCQTTPDAPAPSAPAIRVAHREAHPASTTSTSSSGFSRPSTPPTEVSSARSIVLAPLPDPEETMRRRSQSDMASAEIGKRMLRGWAMLAEECPNGSCYGVPLVRPPKAGGGKDPRKECVACGTVYVFETNARGLGRLVILESARTTSTFQPIENAIAHSQVRLAPDGTLSQVSNHNPQGHPAALGSNESENHVLQASTLTPSASILKGSMTALECSLQVLTIRLNALSSQVQVDHGAMGEVAMSMQKTIDALRTVKHLHYQETSCSIPT